MVLFFRTLSQLCQAGWSCVWDWFSPRLWQEPAWGCNWRPPLPPTAPNPPQYDILCWDVWKQALLRILFKYYTVTSRPLEGLLPWNQAVSSLHALISDQLDARGGPSGWAWTSGWLSPEALCPTDSPRPPAPSLPSWERAGLRLNFPSWLLVACLPFLCAQPRQFQRFRLILAG